ncbi:glycoside hydrolase family 105 protein [Marinoscillum sp. MHG1-6]|uniref:glycoside hydrolase family 88/105 protein n=1 Tax=Marinoscillum sp. MHG1-6 TaxID=2959627 RepID=UPI00215781DF|nr:glycoside hydrolase family 88 protein [Marinoscillum sp. MHG1-6]
MNLSMAKSQILSLLMFALIWSCTTPSEKQSESQKDKRLSVRFAKSEMKRFPEVWMIDWHGKPYWGYTQGVQGKALLDMWRYTEDSIYFNHVLRYADSLVADDGSIYTYDSSKYNIDMINAGKILFPIYKETGDEKYKQAIELLVEQLDNHPKTSTGGFWHKKRYPYQMWLDGLYMGSPFLAQYAAEFDQPEYFDVVTTQFKQIDEHNYSPETSLYHHAWDESKSIFWADPETGLSTNYWGRSLGWLGMALVDVLDYLPEDHPDRPVLVEMVGKVAKGIENMQDTESGVWYQVLDQGDREGNYLEASASVMFVYTLYKAMRKGYIDDSYMEVADKGYAGVLKEFLKENEDGTLTLQKCCAVAGLGPADNPRRDGSFEYYISEPIIDNDAKATGAFIWMSMEKEMLENKQESK